MANGSKRWFQYESDAGLTYAVELDESTYEVASLGFTAIDDDGPVAEGRILQVSASRPLKMRYVNLQSNQVDDAPLRRKVYVGSNESPIFTGQDVTVSLGGRSWSVTSAVGEKRTIPPLTDTGILDGDLDVNIAP